MGKLIDGKAIAKKIENRTARLVRQLRRKGTAPRLAVIFVGQDRPSASYVERKAKAAGRVGIDFVLTRLPAAVSLKKLLKKIKDVQRKEKPSGLIIQLPLPRRAYTPKALNAVRPEIDVDCLTDINFKKLAANTNSIVPPTAGAVVSILDELKIKLPGKKVTILGTGLLVGRPLALLLAHRGASVTACNTMTKNLKARCLNADIIVTAVGRPNLVRGSMIKKNAVVIDVGTSFKGKKVLGDINLEEVRQKASLVTPTPGGVGPVTVANLLWNTALCARRLAAKK